MSALQVPSALADLDAEVESALHDRAGERRTRGDLAGDQASRLRALVGGADLAVEVERPSADQTIGLPPVSARAAPLTVAIASGKGGVGKTNVAVNLAAALAQRGHSVTLLDADLGTANADVICGLTPAARLEHVLTGPLGVHDGGHRTLSQIVVPAPGGFRLIPGSAGIARVADLGAADRHRLFEGLAELDIDTDVLIVDTSAGVGRLVTTFIDAADTCLVVATPEPTSLTDAYALLKCAAMTDHGLEQARHDRLQRRAREGGGAIPRFQIVMNQCLDQTEARRASARVGAVCDRFLGLRVPMLGWIAQDVRVGEAVRARQPVVLRSPASPASQAITALAAMLADQLALPVRTAEPRHGRPRLASFLRGLLGG